MKSKHWRLYGCYTLAYVICFILDCVVLAVLDAVVSCVLGIWFGKEAVSYIFLSSLPYMVTSAIVIAVLHAAMNCKGGIREKIEPNILAKLYVLIPMYVRCFIIDEALFVVLNVIISVVRGYSGGDDAVQTVFTQLLPYFIVFALAMSVVHCTLSYEVQVRKLNKVH